MDLYTAVSTDYAKGNNNFTGTINKVEVKVGGADAAAPSAVVED